MPQFRRTTHSSIARESSKICFRLAAKRAFEPFALNLSTPTPACQWAVLFWPELGGSGRRKAPRCCIRAVCGGPGIGTLAMLRIDRAEIVRQIGARRRREWLTWV